MLDQQSSDQHTAMAEKLARQFYKVVPEGYKTFCAFTYHITQLVLRHFGVPCHRVPCQVWYTQPQKIHVIGFLGQNHPDKWDGHMVCCTDSLLIDTAVHHFERDFAVQVPWVILTRLFEFPSTAIAHLSMGATEGIWWHHPPAGADITPPEEPQEMVDLYARQLIERLAAG